MNALRFNSVLKKGSVPEWLIGADCKSAGSAYAGSNPARPKKILQTFFKFANVTDFILIHSKKLKLKQRKVFYH